MLWCHHYVFQSCLNSRVAKNTAFSIIFQRFFLISDKKSLKNVWNQQKGWKKLKKLKKYFDQLLCVPQLSTFALIWLASTPRSQPLRPGVQVEWQLCSLMMQWTQRRDNYPVSSGMILDQIDWLLLKDTRTFSGTVLIEGVNLSCFEVSQDK